MKSTNKKVFVAKFLLKTDKADKDAIEKRFHALSHIHNVAVKHVKGQIIHLECDPEYRKRMDELKGLYAKKKLDEADKARKLQLSRELRKMKEDAGLTEYGLQHWIIPCRKRYNKLLSCHQVQKEMSRIAKAIDDYFYGKGKDIHFKKFENFDTIQGKSNLNGARFDPETRTVSWSGLELKCARSKKKSTAVYLDEACKHKVVYVTIKRLMFNNGWHYYAYVTFEGKAPFKDHKLGKETAGFDPGVSACNVVSRTKIFMEELAPKCKDYNAQLESLQEKMDRSKRMANPDNYREDGTIRKDKKTWTYSNAYKKDKCKLRCLYRRKHEETVRSHNELANRILEHIKQITAEKMDFKSLALKAKEAERQETPTTITKKDGTKQEICKYKKKKRFGKSINDRSPARFYNTLKNKCIALGGTWQEVHTKTFRASQYDHFANKYEKHELDDRWKTINGHQVQRDLYSAFLLDHPQDDLKHADRDACMKDFDSFLILQNKTIAKMKAANISFPQCFGF